MKNFSYAEDFDEVASVARMNDLDNSSVSYMAFVGTPNHDATFLEAGKFISEDFTTYRDAQNAIALVRRTLELVDEDIAQSLSLADVRDEVLANVERAANEIFEYYIERGA